MQIKKGTQNLRSWVHRMLCHPQAWVPRALIPHQVGLSELSRPAVQDWRCQTQGHMCPSSKAATFTVPLAQTEFLLKEALGMMAHSGPMDDTSVPKCLPQRKRAINSHHQNPVLSQIALAQFSEVSLILGTSSKPVDKASPTVFYASSKSPSLWYLLCPFPGTHKWSQQSPNVGLLLCTGTSFHRITHERIFWCPQGNCRKKTEVNWYKSRTRAWAVSSGKHPMKVKSFTAGRGKRAEPPTWVAPNIQIVFFLPASIVK